MPDEKCLEYNPDLLRKRLEELFSKEKLKGISANKIAIDIGIGRSTISKYIKGTATPSITVLVNLAHYFNVSTDYLLGLTDVPSTNPEVSGIGKLTGLMPEAIFNCMEIREKSDTVKAQRAKEEFNLNGVQTSHISLLLGHGPLEVFDKTVMSDLIADQEFPKLVHLICKYVNISWQRKMNRKWYVNEGYESNDLEDEERESMFDANGDLTMYNISKTAEKITEKIAKKNLKHNKDKITELMGDLLPKAPPIKEKTE